MMAKRQAAKEGDVIDVGTALEVSPDEIAARQAGEAVIGFLKGLGEFFAVARKYESIAVTTLASPKGLPVPTSADQDATIQVFVKQATLDMKGAADHWSICAVLSKFHKWSTTRRAQTVDKLEEAARIGNGLHARYVETERRRVEDEERQRRIAAEEDEQRRRDAEVAELEAKAVAAEEASDGLSERELTFVDLQAVSNNDPRTSAVSARRAGYKDAIGQGARLMTNTKIQAAIKGKLQALAIRDQAAAVQAQPLDVPEIEPVAENIIRVGGAFDRTTWSAEVFDEAAFIKAVVSGRHGIGLEVLTFKQGKVTELARSLHERLNAVPGVRAKKTTIIV